MGQESSPELIRLMRRRGRLFIVVGLALAVLSISGLWLLRGVEPASSSEVAITQIGPPTPLGQARIRRGIVGDEPSSTEVPDLLDSAATREPTPTATSLPTPIPTPEVDPPTPVSINWTEEEKNALSWLCYYEVGGMGATRTDACLSVLSTVRMRYAYSPSFGDDVMSTITQPGQFNVPIRTDIPQSDMLAVVEMYERGSRGSCNAYLYFDSTPGGPVLCTIYGAVGQFVEFHNGWR